MLSEFDNTDKFLRQTSINFKEILHNNLTSPTHKIDGPWEIFPIFDILGVCDSEISDFKSIKENFNSTGDYTIVAISISVFPSGRHPAPHIDKQFDIPGFRRLHLALQLTDTSYLYAKENINDHKYEKYSWVLGRWMEFDGKGKIHYPMNKDANGEDRIVLLLDIFDGNASADNIYEYYDKSIEDGWIERDRFEKIYSEYISEKKNK